MLFLAVVNEMTTDKRMVAFGKRVREARKSKGISQERLAEMAGIDRSYMGNIERGEKNITLKKAYEVWSPSRILCNCHLD